MQVKLNHPFYKWIALTASCVLLAGAFLGTISDTISIITPNVTYICTALILIIGVSAHIYLRLRPVVIINDNRESENLNGLNLKGLALLTGLITILWIPRIFGPESNVPSDEDHSARTNAANLAPARLGYFIASLMLDQNQILPEWSIGPSAQNFPVEWISKGVGYFSLIKTYQEQKSSEKDESNLREQYRLYETVKPPHCSYCDRFRYSKIRVRINGQILTAVDTEREEVKWNLVIYGNDQNPVYADIEPDGNGCYGPGRANCIFNIEAELDLASVNYQKSCAGDFIDGKAALYSIELDGKKPAWLFYQDSSGAGGATSWVDIYWDDPWDYKSGLKICDWIKKEVQETERKIKPKQ